jgi:hypothetical protein
MDGVTIRNRVDREFGMVPRALWQMHLSFAAKGLAAYLCCLRDGDAVPHVAAIEQATGLSRDARRRAFAELIAAGVIAWRSERERGRVLGRFLEIDHAAIRAPVVRADGGAAFRADSARGLPSARFSPRKSVGRTSLQDVRPV